MDTIFQTLDQDQQEKIERWIDIARNPAALAQQKNVDRHLTMDGTEPYEGAIGGGLTYSFTPTGLGMIVKVTCNLTKLELDVTDYASW